MERETKENALIIDGEKFKLVENESLGYSDCNLCELEGMCHEVDSEMRCLDDVCLCSALFGSKACGCYFKKEG